MKLTIVTAVLLGVFLAPSLAVQDVNAGQADSDRKSHQGVSVDYDKNVAIVTSNNGQQSWVSVLDYKTGFLATRIFSKKTCILVKMNKDKMPGIEALPKALDEMKKPEGQRPPPNELRYTVSEKKIQDITQYGEDIAALCHGLPAYEAHMMQGANFFYLGGCLNLNILYILRMDLCLGV
ncbi:PREDICTED: gastrokine-1 [Crocodylus porosus]|uniref:gastrokine-1 n=1 Tax=Crocodylus porosus TaxID=8502 RepID=UPI00093DC18C|nr:PREDICTED: gastrokine-1 [Crocodylus porosus]